MNKITIEMTDPINGYITNDYNLEDAHKLVNSEIDNNKTIFIDGRPIVNSYIDKETLQTCKKEICITPKLSGG